MNHSLIIHCPACDAGYLLPRNLLGPLGARVTCPACREPFEVDAGGALPQGMAKPLASRPSGAGADERAIAREVLDELAERWGDELVAAARENRLFRDHGQELLEAFDAFRERVGLLANAQAFRDEMQRRWRVDLFPLAGARG